MGGGNGDDFDSVGPKYLTCIDWFNSSHRTAVASSLVQGVYTLQRDKIKKRKPLANRWWESLGFSLTEPLITKNHKSIYGAVFEYKNYQSILQSGVPPPRYVIAFRGTMLKLKTWRNDLKDDILCLLNNLNKGSRCKHAIQAIETVLDKHDEKVSIWLAGHSLGGGIALLAGKAMAKRGFPFETYAFNPPNSSFPLEILSNIDGFKRICRLSQSFFKGTIAALFNSLTQQHDPRLAAWIPYVYVNPSDFICAEYIGDCKHKNFMACFGYGKIESVGSGISVRSIPFKVKGAEPIQHLLSADITVNKNKPDVETAYVLKQKWYVFKKAHGLAQWWELSNPDLQANLERYSFRPDKLCLDKSSSSS